MFFDSDFILRQNSPNIWNRDYQNLTSSADDICIPRKRQAPLDGNHGELVGLPASATHDLDAARDVLARIKLQDGTILAEFQRYVLFNFDV